MRVGLAIADAQPARCVQSDPAGGGSQESASQRYVPKLQANLGGGSAVGDGRVGVGSNAEPVGRTRDGRLESNGIVDVCG